MKRSIYGKIRTRSMITLIIAVMAVTFIMGVGLVIAVNNKRAIIGSLSDTAVSNSMQSLTAQTEESLSLLAQSKAAVADERMTDIFMDNSGRGLDVTCAMPYYDGNGNIAGVAGIGMLLATLNEVLLKTIKQNLRKYQMP
ncbi:MAG: hypothetical protein FWE27_06845 [Defluviitaleaceae bacterium]|nr:hypothetical protein [Defluviitaleaceae bacterium]